jgi:uncharacterized membrane protein
MALLQWLRRRFITGFFVAVPLIISVAALAWVFQVLDRLTGPVYSRLLEGREVPGLGLLTTAAFVLLVGVVASNVFGKRLLQQLDRWLSLIPVFRTVYTPVKQLVVAFSPDNESGLKRVVMVRDGCGGLKLGFLTREFTLDSGNGREAMAAVYIPTNHLYLGDVFVYRHDALLFPDITVEEGVRIFLTGGMAMSDSSSARRPEANLPVNG